MTAVTALRLGAAALLLARAAHGIGFAYPDFNSTRGLQLVGSTLTSSCEEEDAADARKQPAYGYQEQHGDHEEGKRLELLEETNEAVSELVVETEDGEDVEGLEGRRAAFGHRDRGFYGGFGTARTMDCPVRLRMTASQPERAGAAWREEGAQVEQGFSTRFTFQINDLSRACTLVRDAQLSTRRYESCAVRGADGFAFVVHGDAAGHRALGEGAHELGAGGLRNALAVEFDFWYNPEAGDLLEDHVTLFSNGPDPLSLSGPYELAPPLPHPLADGREHSARIVYYPYLRTDLVGSFRAGANAVRFMRDNGEGGRLGTLALWLDDAPEPAVAVPINLGVMLELRGKRATVGFTAATGRHWASQNVLSWVFCETFDDAECGGASSP